MVLILPHIVIIALLATQSDAKFPPPSGEYLKAITGSTTVSAIFTTGIPHASDDVVLSVNCAQTPAGIESGALGLDAGNDDFNIADSCMEEYQQYLALVDRYCPGLLSAHDLEDFIYHGKANTIETRVGGKYVTLMKSPP